MDKTIKKNPDDALCGGCGQYFNFAENLNTHDFNCKFHVRTEATEDGHCEKCGWTKMHECCHQCSTCSEGCQEGKHFQKRKITLQRAVTRINMIRNFAGVPCKRCNIRFVERFNHNHLCSYHPEESVRPGICSVCNEKTKTATECCVRCPACASQLGGCCAGKHNPAFVIMVGTNGESIQIPN